MTASTESKLPFFEDQEVNRSTVRVTKTGDGLSDSLEIAPRAWHVGDEAFLLVRARCTQVNHREGEAKIDGQKQTTLDRQHTFTALQMTEVDETFARSELAAASEAIQKARDEAAGQMRLDDDEDPE